MPLSPGTRLGPYEILAPIGAGGMGEVYRASDPRLHRDVAIKIATGQFGERSAREARLVAALNHPNICHLYDVGPNYLVMELVEGPTLAEHLEQGKLPPDEALGIARQIAEALEAAHEKGIVHRDLKPGNIKIRPDGTVKVLDFGLAKIAEEGATSANPESSRTLTVEEHTATGAVIGTAAYMAPEQARGKPVDKRADIWAFGVILYEMLAGQRLFKGETVSDTLAGLLTKEPDLTRVPPSTEPLLRRCLERDPKLRLRDIGDARFLLEVAPQKATLPSGRNWPWKVSTGLLAIASVIALVFLWLNTRHAALPVLRLSVDLGENAALTPIRGAAMSLSPDGSRIVFVIGQQLVKSQLAIRRLDQSNAIILAGTEGAESPFFSPDGKSIGFFADGKLKKMDADGGAATTLCDAPSPREGSWGDDNNIIFAATNQGELWRVPATGGTPQPVTKMERGENSHRYPQVLPGARAFLFMHSVTEGGEGVIEVQSLKTGKRKALVQAGGYGHYLPSGHLVYIHQGTLHAVPMDADRLELTGSPVPVLEDVYFYRNTGTAAFTFSQSGIFAYVAISPTDELRPIGVVDEKGKVELLPIPKARYGRPRISPDGSHLAVPIRSGPTSQIWIYEWGSQRFSRFAFPHGNSAFPVWTPDGKYLIFSTNAQTPGPGIYWMRADGAGASQRLVEGQGLVPSSFSASTARLVYRVGGGPKEGLWNLSLDWRAGIPAKLNVPERFDPSMDSPAAFSPDGRWIAYLGQMGSPEIFVRPFPGPGGPWQVSTGGGMPVWSSNGRELFYQAKPDFRIMVVDYSVTGDSLSPAPPRVWSETKVESLDAMPDGKHIVMLPAIEQKSATHAVFLLNFVDDLRRRVPPGK